MFSLVRREKSVRERREKCLGRQVSHKRKIKSPTISLLTSISKWKARFVFAGWWCLFTLLWVCFCFIFTYFLFWFCSFPPIYLGFSSAISVKFGGFFPLLFNNQAFWGFLLMWSSYGFYCFPSVFIMWIKMMGVWVFFVIMLII